MNERIKQSVHMVQIGTKCPSDPSSIRRSKKGLPLVAFVYFKSDLISESPIILIIVRNLNMSICKPIPLIQFNIFSLTWST